MLEKLIKNRESMPGLYKRVFGWWMLEQSIDRRRDKVFI